MAVVPFYQYIFIFQTNKHLITCHRITSSGDSIIIERNHMFGHKNLNELMSSSSSPESYVWIFTKRNDTLQPPEEIQGRRISVSWTEKEWSPLGLFYGSSECAMEMLRLVGVRYAGVNDIAHADLPPLIRRFLTNRTGPSDVGT